MASAASGALSENGTDVSFNEVRASIVRIEFNSVDGSVAGLGEVEVIARAEAADLLQSVHSIGAQDGSILESTEMSDQGGNINSAAATLNLGDDAANRQYRAILSFDTSLLPDNAVITSALLKFKYSGAAGTNPFTTHGNILADICNCEFSNNAALQPEDFQAQADKNNILTFTKSKVDSWYSQAFDPSDFGYINLDGLTQFRLGFETDDNNDLGADLLKIYSSNSDAKSRPRLIIQYYVP
jgi:hypothetical protein